MPVGSGEKFSLSVGEQPRALFWMLDVGFWIGLFLMKAMKRLPKRMGVKMKRDLFMVGF